jgi:hypothetical protein
MAEMKLIAITLTEEFVTLRLADSEDPDEAEEWIEFQVPIDALTLPTASGEVSLGDVQKHYLASIQRAALRYAQDALSEAEDSLPELKGR